MLTAMVITFDLPWTAGPVLLVAAVLPVAYTTILNYFIAELLMRPVIEDIASSPCPRTSPSPPTACCCASG